MSKNQKSPNEFSRCIKLYTNASVVAGQPVKVGAVLGTAVSAEDSDGYTVVDVGPMASYEHSVRNVTAYNGGTEQTYAAVTQGKKIYYDPSSTMPTGVYLSTSAEDKDEAATTLFGKYIGASRTTATVKTETLCEILQDKGA